MTDAPPPPVSEGASEPSGLGENPSDLSIGVAVVTDATGRKKVVMRFDQLIQWFDMEPTLAVAIAEKLLDCAEEAARPSSRIVQPQKPGLIT